MARVFVITGPSGVGKGTLIRGLMERLPQLELSVSATTRAPRPGEEDGVDYHFLSSEEFERRVKDGEFVEHADYAGRRYGTLPPELEHRVADGAPVVLEIEVQGARQVRACDARGDPGVPGATLACGATHAAYRKRNRRQRRGGAQARSRRARARRTRRVRPRRRQRPARRRARRSSWRSSPASWTKPPSHYTA